ncbi:MAG: type II toxin-antitoxin system VapC family toxin [Proteobacteria bacterium]|nr:type II toxin-antitoxin system VapC family toxin [Pseudomonadota bacterium]MBI3498031.1 type II toxin-antitoxin system VapC family toxin [Pseudomonadota bacterium]
MKLLLDTHIILWSAGEPKRLPSAAAQALEDEANQLWYSPISVWEVLMLAEKGRLSGVGKSRERFVERLFAGLSEAPLNTHVAIASRAIDLPHGDPADRFIAATARVYGLQLVTEDAKLASAVGVDVFR